MSESLIVYDQDQFFIDWINKELDVTFVPEDTRTISHVRKNDDGTFTVLAVIAFNRWSTNSAEASIASSSPRWATWKFLNAAYRFIFDTGRSKINFVVELSNAAAINMHKKLGNHLEGYLKDQFGEGNDAYLFGMTKSQFEQSKWFKKNNKENL